LGFTPPAQQIFPIFSHSKSKGNGKSVLWDCRVGVELHWEVLCVNSGLKMTKKGELLALEVQQLLEFH